MYNKYNCCCWGWLINKYLLHFIIFRVRFFENLVTCFYFFSHFVLDYLLQGLSFYSDVCPFFICFFSLFDRLEVFIFFSPYRESRMIVNTAVSYFSLYFFSYIHDTFNALGLSVSCLYIFLSLFLLLFLSELMTDDLFFIFRKRLKKSLSMKTKHKINVSLVQKNILKRRESNVLNSIFSCISTWHAIIDNQKNNNPRRFITSDLMKIREDK
jgi:hypothetical protein